MSGMRKRLPPWLTTFVYLAACGVSGYAAVSIIIALFGRKSINTVLVMVTFILVGVVVAEIWRTNRAWRLNNWNVKAVELKKQGRYEEAMAAYDQAIKLAPKNWFAWNNKMNLLTEDLKRYNEAIATCEQAEARGVSFAGLWSIKGDALRALGRTEEAQAAYTKALALHTDDYLGWASSGEALYGLGRYEEAFAAYDRSLTLRPGSAGVWRCKARVFRALGCEADAQQAEEQARQLEAG